MNARDVDVGRRGMALSTPTLRAARSALGVARKAEMKAAAAAADHPDSATVAALSAAADRVLDARKTFEVERALAHLRAISGPTTGEQRARLEEAVHATAGGGACH